MEALAPGRQARRSAGRLTSPNTIIDLVVPARMRQIRRPSSYAYVTSASVELVTSRFMVMNTPGGSVGEPNAGLIVVDTSPSVFKA